MVETACQPVLDDHGSCWLECKHCFLLASPVAKSGGCRLERKHRFSLATPVAKSFTFVWLLWRDNFAEQQKVTSRNVSYVSCFLLLINRNHEPDTPTKFLACYFRCELFLVSRRNLRGISFDNFANFFFFGLSQLENGGWWLLTGLLKRCTW